MRADEFLKEALKPEAMAALQQARGTIAQQRDQDVAAWQSDFERNMAKRMAAAKPNSPPPAAAPNYKNLPYAELKTKLAGVNTAIAKMQELEKLRDRAEKRGLMNPGLEADTDMKLYLSNGDQDNYVTLIQKADTAIQRLQQRLNINRMAYK